MKKLSYLLFLLLIPWWGCRKDVKNAPNSGPAAQTVGDLQFILETTDMNDNVQSVFRQGENFKLTLLIKNHSSETVKLCDCFVTDSYPDLLAVYAADKIDMGAKNGIIEPGDSIGKPWDGAGGYFILAPTRIGANSYIKYSLPWSPQTGVRYNAPEPFEYLVFNAIQNPKLSPGQYYTQFDFKYLNKSIHLKYYFSIQ
jgi:hypothetical protein